MRLRPDPYCFSKNSQTIIIVVQILAVVGWFFVSASIVRENFSGSDFAMFVWFLVGSIIVCKIIRGIANGLIMGKQSK